MKIEIEIPDRAIKEAVESDVARAIQVRSNYWASDEIKKIVSMKWDEVVPKLIQERLSDSEYLSEMID